MSTTLSRESGAVCGTMSSTAMTDIHAHASAAAAKASRLVSDTDFASVITRGSCGSGATMVGGVFGIRSSPGQAPRTADTLLQTHFSKSLRR